MYMDSQLTYTIVVILFAGVALRLLSGSKGKKVVKFHWKPDEKASPAWRGPVLTNPSLTSHLSPDFPSIHSSPIPASTPHLTSYDPSTGSILNVLPTDTANSIQEKIQKAEVAQNEWSKTSWEERRNVMRSLMQWVREDADNIARVACRDTGKTMIDAYFGEILTTLEKLRFLISQGEKVLKPDRRPINLMMAHKISEVRYEPRGVVAALVSWNYPFHNLISPIIAALFSGNSIILKPSEQTAYSSLQFISALKSCLTSNGHSSDLIQSVICFPDVAEVLTGDERIKHITFIGSVEVGRIVARKASEVGTECNLELGGKDAAVVLESADVKTFAPTWMRGVFQAAGQNCIGIERLLVSSKIYDKVIEDLEPRVRSLKVGAPLDASNSERVDMGAMVSDRPFDRLESLIDSAVRDGAKLLVGGKRLKPEKWSGGSYFEPTLIVDVMKEMEIANVELFAPVMVVMKFETVDEAIAIANGTKYGLGASVFGRNKRECEYVTSRLKAGMVCTNDFGVFYMNQSLPFGGCNASGYGRFAGPEGLRALCNVKSVTIDRLHGLIQTSIPEPVAYPIDRPKVGWAFVRGVGQLGYAESWFGTLKGIWMLVTASRVKE